MIIATFSTLNAFHPVSAPPLLNTSGSQKVSNSCNYVLC